MIQPLWLRMFSSSALPKNALYTYSDNDIPHSILTFGVFLQHKLEAERFKGHTIAHKVLGHGFDLFK